ncbi:MAG: substrate-binding domain-containing protein [Candidatus Omnitrophica bacterium]|nr:substrate-binding domain-containing protein [Candidatus Omnitrophota bacterium]MCM8790550.1 substrate-binding domain-containing protein [Candidatus Omnitrophota bacterium]
MRFKSCIAAAVILLLSCQFACSSDKDLERTITISGAWAMYPTVIAWAEGFQKAHPTVKIDVSAGGAGKGASDAMAGLVDIGMVSREPDPAELKKGIVAVYVLHDAVYPVVSEKNPVLKELMQKGVSKNAWTAIYITGAAKTWDDIAGSKTGKPIHVYTRSDSCGAAASWAAFTGKKQEDLKGVGVYGDPGILETVKRDPLGVGYNNFSYIFTREGKIVDGVLIVPIDSNDNGRADANEIFGTRQAAIRAIEDGSYPVGRKNYLFVKGKPKRLVREFIEFALSDEGSKIVEEVGASLPLPKEERLNVLSGIE